MQADGETFSRLQRSAARSPLPRAEPSKAAAKDIHNRRETAWFSLPCIWPQMQFLTHVTTDPPTNCNDILDAHDASSTVALRCMMPFILTVKAQKHYLRTKLVRTSAKTSRYQRHDVLNEFLEPAPCHEARRSKRGSAINGFTQCGADALNRMARLKSLAARHTAAGIVFAATSPSCLFWPEGLVSS
jgi:hypothetical protein